MKPRWHILFGFVFSYTLVYFFDYSLFAGLIVFLSSVFIDLDHVLLYFLETKNLDPWKFFAWGDRKNAIWIKLEKEERNNLKSPHFILHGIEFILLLSLFSFIHSLFFWIFLGISLHLVLDYIDLYSRREYYHFSVKFSQVWLWHRNKTKKPFNLV